MEFNLFSHSTSPVVYLQVFVYSELVLKSKKSIEINDYNNFELTDSILSNFNNWVLKKEYLGSSAQLWFMQSPEQVQEFTSQFGSKYKPKVEIWSDRDKSFYYKQKLQESFDFENHIAKLLSEQYGLVLNPYLTPEGQYTEGENELGIEIKNDRLIEKYGNAYIEYAEKSKGTNTSYVNSGILKADNSIYFLIGTVDRFYIFRKTRLVQIFKEENELFKQAKSSPRHVLFKETPTSRGYVYPIKYAVNDTITIDEMVGEIKARLKGDQFKGANS